MQQLLESPNMRVAIQPAAAARALVIASAEDDEVEFGPRTPSPVPVSLP